MRTMTAVLLLLAATTSVAGQRWTTNTLRLAQGEKSPPATIADMGWYEGRWTGSGLGGHNEEVWSPPRDGAMMGMYRMIKDGKPVFYELLIITEESGSLMIKLKHFHPDLRGWEERDASVRFPLVAKRDNRIYFDGMVATIRCTRQADGERHQMIPYADGCRRGVIRYVGHAEPIHTFYCHCSDCQKETGGPFAAEIYVPRGSVVIRGTLASYAVTGDSGSAVTRTFCSACGCPITTEFASDANCICVKACSLDDATWLVPEFHLYVVSKQPWFPILDGLPQYQRDFEW